jgi:hypothetical protein
MMAAKECSTRSPASGDPTAGKILAGVWGELGSGRDGRPPSH